MEAFFTLIQVIFCFVFFIIESVIFVLCLSTNFLLDSVIFVGEKANSQISLGDGLGELTDEEPNGIIKKFVSCGPKNYGYQVHKEDGTIESKLKIKGICLYQSTLDVINLQKMVEIATKYVAGDEKTLKVVQQQIMVGKHHDIKTREFEKIFRVVSKKRNLKANNLVPFGFHSFYYFNH